ncbi:MAG: bifunctional phosphoribosylaminoimidazolecarboxamide formyltransferase/IMP cyclohydrolase [Candidatus Thermoplasmatota archaeon]|nr:bifunctional phosphoribosylaminoimidazolecarboxamide formyltransferase/IMP cyclohydrolase [Candidatus Thermoplasmatota archaeon]
MIPNMALVSVYNKEGIENFCAALYDADIKMFSTGGTAERIKNLGIPVRKVEEITGFSELMDGRIKTLHTSIYAGIMARRGSSDMKELTEKKIIPIDMVVCNFYSPEVGMDRMDIGGPCMVRAAAKNWKDVVVVSHPSQYSALVPYLKKGFDDEMRKKLAIEAIHRTSYYDARIIEIEDNENFPEIITLPYKKSKELRYGENPHQKGAFYTGMTKESCIASAKKLQGKEISYNNILDANEAIECIKEFEEPTVVIIKHATPSGIASAGNVIQAWKDAFATDEYSPFGGVVAVNREVDGGLAEKMTKIFLEVIIAPSFSSDAKEILAKKKNLRLLQVEGLERADGKERRVFRSVVGGLLMQERDIKKIDTGKWRTVTEKKPSQDNIQSMIFAVKCVKHVKSNAVVFVKGTKTVAIGGGQTSRVDASWIAVHKGEKKIKDSIMASDAFFPFRDAVDVAAEAGVKAIIQPGGSIRDKEVVEAANEHGIAMVFSGQRYFLH